MKTKNIFLKILCVILTVVTACFAFVACGETPPPEEGGGSQVTVTELTIFRMPNQTEYEEGEEFNPTGMVLQVTFSDGSKRAISPQMCEASVTGALPAGTTKITFTYEGVSVDLPISVKEFIQGEVVSEVLDADLDNDYVSNKTLFGEYTAVSKEVTTIGCKIQNQYVSNGIGDFNGEGKFITYTFTVTEGCTVDFIWNIAGCWWSSSGNKGLSDMANHIEVTIDGKAVNVSGIALPAGPTTTTAENYWNVQQVVIKDVELTAGTHTFIAETLQAGGANVESMEIYFE